MTPSLPQSRATATNPLVAACSLALELLGIAVIVAGACILATGGSAFDVAGFHIRARTLRNPVLLFAIVVFLRALLVARAPRFLGVPGWDLRELPSALARLKERTESPPPHALNRVVMLVIGVIAISTIIKLLNAWFHFGFYSGDDVEIQEMSLSHLFGYPWTAWNLRNAFYPMAVIYPVQATLNKLGVTDPAMLVFAARAVVATFAAITMWLVFLAARREFNSVGTATCAVLFLGLNKLHVAFASTELPRPVAAAFVVAAYFLLLVNRRTTMSIAAGILLGIGASLRFSEAIFVVPAVLALAVAGRQRDGLVVALSATAAAVGIVAVSDALYWKQPLFSAWNLIDYTLVKGLSSRGHQSTFYYLTSLTDWTDVVTAGFALIGIHRAPRLALWFVVPLTLLSCLPHKESRYLVPLMPFYAMLAGVGLWNVATRIVTVAEQRQARWTATAAVLLVGSLMVLTLLEVEGFRFRRSESAVEVARFLAQQCGPLKVGIEDTFRAGSSIYLRRAARLEQIDPVDVRRSPVAMARRLREADLDYVALADEDVRKYGYEGLLSELGFVEIDYKGATQYDRFRVFKAGSGEARQR